MEKKKKLKTDMLKKNYIFCIYLFFIVVFMFHYISLSARDIVFMDYWKYINSLIEPVMNGTWQWKDFWRSYHGQRNVFELILIALNIKYLNLNCILESYLGILVIAGTSFIVFCEWSNCFLKLFGEKYCLSQFLYLPIIFTLFNLNQWEILSLQFSFVFMLRLFCYILIFVLLGRYLLNTKTSWKNYLVLGIFAGAVIALISQLYWPNLVLTLIVVWGLDIIIKKKFIILKFISFWIPVIISMGIYFLDMDMSHSGSNYNNFFPYLFEAVFFKGACYMLASSFIPQSYIYKMNSVSVYGIGVILMFICAYAFYLFINNRLYSYSYLPLFLSVFGIISILSITYGRAFVFNIEYLSASRYTCETTLIWCGVLFIFLLLMPQRINILNVFSISVIVALMVLSFVTEYKIAPYRGEYKDSCIRILRDIDNHEDKELEALQSVPQLVRSDILLLKKYSLNVFSNAE